MNVNRRLKTAGRLPGMSHPDTDDVEPRHASQRLFEHIAREIDLGRLPAGAQLPSYRQLATEHDIAINTAQSAIRLLAGTGRVVIRPSSGAYVADGAADPGDTVQLTPAELAALRDQVRRARTTLADVERTLGGLIERVGPVVGSDS